MHPLGDARRHFLLTIGAARAAGVDLGRALAEGAITRADYADLVSRCRACDAPDACARWIEAALEAAPATDLPPDFCPNGGLLAELSRL